MKKKVMKNYFFLVLPVSIFFDENIQKSFVPRAILKKIFNKRNPVYNRL